MEYIYVYTYTMVYIFKKTYNGILYNSEQEQSIASHNNMDICARNMLGNKSQTQGVPTARFHLDQVQNEAKLVYGVKRQDVVTIGRE